MRRRPFNQTIVLLKSLLAVSTLLLSAHVSAEADPRSLKHPLIGYWESHLPENGCLESYWFKEDGTAVFTSGDEQLEATEEEKVKIVDYFKDNVVSYSATVEIFCKIRGIEVPSVVSKSK